MRLIDADALMDEIAVLLERNEKLIDGWLANIIDDTIEQAPIIDVVRCKDCKHWGDTICNRFEEERIMWQNDFCSYGEERKE